MSNDKCDKCQKPKCGTNRPYECDYLYDGPHGPSSWTLHCHADDDCVAVATAAPPSWVELVPEIDREGAMKIIEALERITSGGSSNVGCMHGKLPHTCQYCAYDSDWARREVEHARALSLFHGEMMRWKLAAQKLEDEIRSMVIEMEEKDETIAKLNLRLNLYRQQPRWGQD